MPLHEPEPAAPGPLASSRTRAATPVRIGHRPPESRAQLEEPPSQAEPVASGGHTVKSRRVGIDSQIESQAGTAVPTRFPPPGRLKVNRGNHHERQQQREIMG